MYFERCGIKYKFLKDFFFLLLKDIISEGVDKNVSMFNVYYDFLYLGKIYIFGISIKYYCLI